MNYYNNDQVNHFRTKPNAFCAFNYKINHIESKFFCSHEVTVYFFVFLLTQSLLQTIPKEK